MPLHLGRLIKVLNSHQDTGNVRWYVFIPGEGKFAVPPGVSDREAYALRAGATRLFFGDQVVWSRPAGHLAVVR